MKTLKKILKKLDPVIVFRNAVLVVLLFFVYGETGWATTLCMILIGISVEAQAFLWRRQRAKNPTPLQQAEPMQQRLNEVYKRVD